MVNHVRSNLKITDPLLNNTLYLNKFLVIKKYDLTKAEKLYEDHIKFRSDNNIEGLIKEDWVAQLAALKKLYPRSYYHTDKEGRPVLIESIGKAKFAELFKVSFLDSAL